MQTLIERIDGFVPVVHTRVTRNDDAYRETETYFRESLEELLKKLREAEHEQRQRLVRDDIDNALRRYHEYCICLLYTSPSPRDRQKSRMPSSA